MKIPVTAVNIGPVHKKDVLKATKSLGVINTHKEFATLLAFDVKVMPDAEKFAEEEGVKIFTANIIYHLFDSFTEYVKKCKDDRKADDGKKAVFPAICEVSKISIVTLYKDGQRCMLQYQEPYYYWSCCEGRST